MYAKNVPARAGTFLKKQSPRQYFRDCRRKIASWYQFYIRKKNSEKLKKVQAFYVEVGSISIPRGKCGMEFLSSTIRGIWNIPLELESNWREPITHLYVGISTTLYVPKRYDRGWLRFREKGNDYFTYMIVST